MTELTIPGKSKSTTSDASNVSRQRVILGGRLLLALALLLGWELGARTMGAIFFAAPLDVAVRIVQLAQSGQLVADIAATLRVSALGFVIACVAGVLLPFLLRRSPRFSAAVEPYIMASMGIPKYALAPWLILWFGIGDLPKLVVVTLMVFYIIFITTSAGIRAVDVRLVAMARIAGAGESVIAREIVWRSLLPFFFTGLKVALPRAVSATIVGEFLVASEGVGHYIESSRQISDTVGVFAGIVVATALVLAINAVVTVIERRALAWRPVERDMQL
jgi:NitT/TauT family transport system permease protein